MGQELPRTPELQLLEQNEDNAERLAVIIEMHEWRRGTTGSPIVISTVVGVFLDLVTTLEDGWSRRQSNSHVSNNGHLLYIYLLTATIPPT